MGSISTFVKLAVSAALITWILSDIDASEILAVLGKAQLGLLGIAFSLHGVGLLLSAKRWEILLDIEKIKLSFKATVLTYWIGSFFNAFLPTSVGGDVIRSYLVFKQNGKGMETAITVVFERIAGVVGLIIIFALGALWFYVSQGERPLRHIGPASAFDIGGQIVAGAFCFPAVLQSSRAEWRAAVQRLLHLLLKYRNHKLELCWIIGLSVLLQINVIAGYFLTARALNLDLPLVHFCLYIPPILVVTMLPLSFGGVGIREAAFLFFFLPLGNASPAEILSLSMSSYLLALMAGLLGGLIYCFHRPSYP